VGVERRLEEAVAHYRKTSIDAPATGDDPAREVALVAPDLAARSRVDCPAEIFRPSNVDDAIEHNRRRFEFSERVGLECPLRCETLHVLRSNLCQWTVTLTSIVTTVGRPASRVLQSLAHILKRHPARRRRLLGERQGAHRHDQCRHSQHPKHPCAHRTLLSGSAADRIGSAQCAQVTQKIVEIAAAQLIWTVSRHHGLLLGDDLGQIRLYIALDSLTHIHDLD
jgi:hypothetical protein